MLCQDEDVNGTSAAILAYLSTEPQTGWDIGRGLQSLIGDFWNVTPSQVYRELRSMAAAGLVEAGASGPRDRRPYSITDQGREELHRWLEEEPASDVVRIPLLLKLFLQFTVADAKAEDVSLLVRAYRTEHERNLAGYQAKLAEFEKSGTEHAHIVRYGVFHEEAVLAWLDTLPWG